MTIHYHGLPITPNEVFYSLAGRCFCVSYGTTAKSQVRKAHDIGQSVMLDNGAFSLWKSGTPTDWDGYYRWADPWLDYPTTWAVIPDVIEGGSQEQDGLIREWPFGNKGSPVFHLDPDFMQPVARLLRLIDEWPRVCIGWADKSPIMSPPYVKAMDTLWNEVAKAHARTPTLHKLRGMQLVTKDWPFASVDSTDIGRNHNRPHNTARAMADRWDAAQCPPRWTVRAAHPDLFGAAA